MTHTSCTILAALAGCGASPRATNPPVVQRQTLVSVMSWYPRLGDLNGVTAWQAGGYRNHLAGRERR